MKSGTPISQTVAPLMFKLLPIQILLALISSVNSIISSLFAGNMIGPEAMTVTGYYTPVLTLLTAISAMLVGGSQIICDHPVSRGRTVRLQQSVPKTAFTLSAYSLQACVFFNAGSDNRMPAMEP